MRIQLSTLVPELEKMGFTRQGCHWADNNNFFERIIPGRASFVVRRGKGKTRMTDHGEVAWVFTVRGKLVVQRITKTRDGFKNCKLENLRKIS